MGHYKQEAHTKYMREIWRPKNKIKHRATVKASRRKFLDKIYSFKNVPCSDCKVEYPYFVMDFDHVRGKKVANISGMIWKSKRSDILKEIEKCDVVCSNCHRIRTYNRNKV